MSGIRPVTEVVTPVDASPYLELLEERFGIERRVFDPFVFFRPKKGSLWLVNRDLQAPERPEPHVLGMPFFRTNMRFPRPSTNAVLRFGSWATRNVVPLREDVEDEPAMALYRRTLRLDPERAAALDGHGYVILFLRGRPLGLGYFRSTGELKGMCPKKWTAKLGLLPPAERPMPWDEEETTEETEEASEDEDGDQSSAAGSSPKAGSSGSES